MRFALVSGFIFGIFMPITNSDVKPSIGLDFVFFHAVPIGIHITEIELSLCKPLLRSFSIPIKGSLCFTLFGTLSPFRNLFGGVFAVSILTEGEEEKY